MSLLTSAATAAVVGAMVLVAGCARIKSTVTERTGADGVTERVTRVKAGTLLDSKSELTKLSSGPRGRANGNR